MICRLFGLPNVSQFPIYWVPLIDKVVDDHVLNRTQILCDNLAKHILHFLSKQMATHKLPFFTSSFVMDTMFFLSTSHAWARNGNLSTLFPYTFIIVYFRRKLVISNTFFSLWWFLYTKPFLVVSFQGCLLLPWVVWPKLQINMLRRFLLTLGFWEEMTTNLFYPIMSWTNYYPNKFHITLSRLV